MVEQEGTWNLHGNVDNSGNIVVQFDTFTVKGYPVVDRNTKLEFFHGAKRFSSIYFKGIDDEPSMHIEQWPLEQGHRLVQLSSCGPLSTP